MMDLGEEFMSEKTKNGFRLKYIINLNYHKYLNKICEYLNQSPIIE